MNETPHEAPEPVGDPIRRGAQDGETPWWNATFLLASGHARTGDGLCPK